MTPDAAHLSVRLSDADLADYATGSGCIEVHHEKARRSTKTKTNPLSRRKPGPTDPQASC